MPHLLVVDGEPSARDLLQCHAGRPCRVTWIPTRHEARNVLRRGGIDLVVLEARLPDGCGLEFLNEIKANHPALPVIMVTGYGSEAVCAKALKLGTRDYFTKPVVAVDLWRSIRRILSVTRGQGHLRENILRPLPMPTLTHYQTGHPRIDFAVRLVHDRYDDRLTLGAIARTTSTGVFSLSRTFSAVMGVPFRTYLLRVRIARARELLQDGTVPVADVAERVGFRDPSWFNKVFKRYQGVPPSVYRGRARARNSRSNGKKLLTPWSAPTL